MLIKKLSAIAAICGFCTFSNPAVADESSDLKAMLEKQQAQIEALSNKLEKQQTVHNEALTHYIKNEVDRALKDSNSSLLTLGSNVENLTFKGDLRVRYENVDWDSNNKADAHSKAGKTQDRFRQRLRLGFLWKTNEGWEIGAGIATGGSDATSTNDTYSEGSAFESGDIRIDYAYAKHKFDGGLSLILGQQKNPFVNSDIFFDSDVRPVGITGQFKGDGFFATLGGYEVYNFDKDDEDSAKLVAAQVGFEADGFLAAIGYYHFNSAGSINPDGNVSLGNTDFDIAHAYAEYSGKTEDFKYTFYGEYFVNVGADSSGTSQVTGLDPEDEDSAFILGADLSISKFKLGYQYANVEADSMVAYLTDGDYAAGVNNTVNSESHTFKLGYKVTKNFSVGAKYVMAEEIEGSDEGELFQLDFKYKF